MHLGIDVREACQPERTGKGQWTYGFVTELLKRNISLTLFTNLPLPNAWNESAKKDTVHVQIIPHKGLLWHRKVAAMVRNDPAIDGYVGTVSYIVPYLLGRSKPVIPIVHDLIAFQREPHDKKAKLIERLTLKKVVRNAAFVCTVSDMTRAELLSRYLTISSGSFVSIYAAPTIATAAMQHTEDRYILCIGTLCPRKNQKNVILGYSKLPEELKKKHPLILVGKRGWHDDDIIKLIAKTKGVEWKKYLSDDECRDLLSKTAVFVFPSFYEGFGLPVLDAMLAGVPVITSDRSSLQEVAGDAALLVNPYDDLTIRDHLLRLLSDDLARKELAEKGKKRAASYSWKRTVDLFLEAAKGIDKRE